MERLTREERRQQTRERLLDAAQRLFAERGLSASLDDVAAAAGLTKGAVYSNFANKEELLLALVRRRGEQRAGLDAAAMLTDPKMPLENRLNALAVLYAPTMADPGTRAYVLLTVEFWVEAMRNERLRDAYAEALRQIRAGVAAEIAEHGLADRLGTTPEEAAALVVALDVGMAMQHLVAPEETPGMLYARGLERLLGSAALEERP